jgi:uncharacterized protein (TIGR02246 family)
MDGGVEGKLPMRRLSKYARCLGAHWDIATVGRAVLVSAILSCFISSARAVGPPVTDPAATTAINEANAQWLPAMKRGDVAAIVAPYAEDAVFVTASGEAIRGRDAIAELYHARLAAVTAVVGGDIVSDGRVIIAPALIYEWGHASLILARKDGSQIKGGGPYLTVWRRDGSGRWLIIRNVVF